MSTALITFDDAQRDLLRKTIASGTTPEQFELFVLVCMQTGLNPFARQIYAVVRMEKQYDGTKTPKMTIQTSIDGFRLQAQRSKEYLGQDGPYWYDAESKQWVDVWLKSEPPAAAKVGVLRKGFQQYLYAVARFDSYVARAWNNKTQAYDGAPLNLWAKMPEVMIAKVAEALALRRAFPAELSGLYTAEEMQQAGEPLPTVSVEPVASSEGAVEADSEVVVEVENKQRDKAGQSNNNRQPAARQPQQNKAPVTPVAQPQSEPEPLNEIPTVSQLRTKATSLGLDWGKDVLPGAFKTPISQGQVTVKQLLATGDEMPPDACKRINRYLVKCQLAQPQAS